MATPQQVSKMTPDEFVQYCAFVIDQLTESINDLLNILGEDGQNYMPAVAVMAALANVVASGLPKDEPARSTEIERFIRYFVEEATGTKQ